IEEPLEAVEEELIRLIDSLRKLYPEEELDVSEDVAVIQAEIPSELGVALEKQKSVWEELSQTLSINDIEDYANQMKVLGNKYEYIPLVQWAEKLAEQTSSFDLDQMAETLVEYSDFLAAKNI
ncbi:MAG: hypothetical protein HN521_01590, partial [Candidatus Latescibacteria bacterium]|nr:hypothetical protein [Candidatus Latescibacterota bacterium]